MRIIDEELKPLVLARFNVDRSQQILYGHSVGGPLALRALFRNPTAFSTYTLSSPAIFLAARDVLKYEAALWTV